MNCNPRYCSFSVDGRCTKEICVFRMDNNYCEIFGGICPVKGEE